MALSGANFAIWVNLFLRKLCSILDNVDKSKSRACADGVGCALRDSSSLTELELVFHAAHICAGLTLKPKICMIIPSKEFSEKRKQRIKTLLESNLSVWEDFTVKNMGKYLGFMCGPAISNHTWSKSVRAVRRYLLLQCSRRHRSRAC